ncbi:MAG: TetR/AcrR family transcriptional regulator [Candidatus Dormibacter sp.]|uniref:TetR/AcrR family transcriptional regulator n=1 Tax=Candidatus Dormibacter sp. TaxID=2973982 RepID=UPI000DB09DBE|nr:MAG: TetR/AcrR family transcriptional regulator [Candidatus Dormibacteraeota bacterium]
MTQAHARDRLLAAGGELFYNAGLTATGVDAVVRTAGVSKPTLYAHFRSKGQLVTAVLEQRHEQRVEELRAWVNRTDDIRQRPLAVFTWLADWYERDGARGCAFLNAAAELVDPQDPARGVVSREKRWLVEFLAQLASDADLRRPEQLASQLLLLIDGVSGRVLVQGVGAAPRVVAEATQVAALLVAAAGTDSRT